jgi:cbb3-type cytochrome oxidase subunit 3
MVINSVRIFFTLLSFAFFIWVCFNTFSAKKKDELEEAARLPFQD